MKKTDDSRWRRGAHGVDRFDLFLADRIPKFTHSFPDLENGQERLCYKLCSGYFDKDFFQI